MARTLAIDLGGRRMGLALSDSAGTLATPLEVVTVSSPEAALEAVIEVVRREDARRIVIGLPVNMDDSLGPAARQVLRWGRELGRRLLITPTYVDERLSSFTAEQQLAERRRAGEKLTRGRKRQQRDAIAAAGFLQEFLDGRLPALDVGE